MKLARPPLASPLAASAKRVRGSIITAALAGIAAVLVGACGGGGDAGGSDPPSSPAPGAYTVGGSVAGLSGSGLVLQNNLGDDLGVAADGGFTFETAVANGATYSVTVRSEPPHQSCSVIAGAGTVAGAAITSVRVQCASVGSKAYPRQLFVDGSGFNEDEDGRLNAYAIDGATGTLTRSDSVVVDGGPRSAPLVHPSGRFVYVVRARIASLRVDDTTGQLERIGSDVDMNSTGPKGAAMDPLGRFALIGNSAYTINASTGALTRQPAPGITDAFARGLVIDPRGRFAYSIEGFASGLATYQLDAATGVPTRLTQPQPAGARPVALVIDPQGRFVFVATSKTTGPDDSIQAFAADAATGSLTPLPGVLTGLVGTRSLAIHPSGRWLLVTADSGAALLSVDTATGVVANAGAVGVGPLAGPVAFDPSGTLIYIAGVNGDMSILRFDAATGLAKPAGVQPTLPSANAIALSAATAALQPGPRFAISTSGNEGLIRVWRSASNGAISQVGPPIVADLGTRPAVPQVHPSQRFVYVAEEFGSLQGNDRVDALVRAYAIDANSGALALINALPSSRQVFGLALDPGGRFAYALNPAGAASDPTRGTVRVLAIDAQTGALSDAGAPIVTTGRRSVDLRIEPRGRFAYAVNQTSNDVSAFAILGTGELVPAGTFPTSSQPLKIGFSADGERAYVFNAGDGTVVTYRIDAGTGALAVVGITPFGSDMVGMTLHPNRPYLYVVERVAGRVTAYRIDSADGQPVPIGGGGVASNHADFIQIDPSGRFAYVTSASSAPHAWNIFRVDADSGALADTGAAIPTDGGMNGLAFTVGLQ